MINIFSRETLSQLWETYKEKGLLTHGGLCRTYSWHGVNVHFMSGYPTEEVFCDIEGKNVADYFEVEEDEFWNNPELVENVTRLFLGEYYEELSK